jgi:HSP20 family protein
MAETKEMQKKEAQVSEEVETTRATRVYVPNTDIMEQQNCIVLTADMPGVDESSIDITLEKNVLTIYGKVEPEVHENYRLVYSEYGIGDYRRAFTLSDEIDREKIEAAVKNGVLRLILPKVEKAKTKKIPIKAEGF